MIKEVYYQPPEYFEFSCGMCGKAFRCPYYSRSYYTHRYTCDDCGYPHNVDYKEIENALKRHKDKFLKAQKPGTKIIWSISDDGEILSYTNIHNKGCMVESGLRVLLITIILSAVAAAMLA